LPTDETTPPVKNKYFVIMIFLFLLSLWERAG